MKAWRLLSLTSVALLLIWPLATSGLAQKEQKPTVQIPKPGVPQIMTLEGTYIRAAYNNEGYAILGYRVANQSIGEEWMLLEVGMTVLDDIPDYRLTREALSLETPDGKTIPLATVIEQREGNPQAIQQRARDARQVGLDVGLVFAADAHDDGAFLRRSGEQRPIGVFALEVVENRERLEHHVLAVLEDGYPAARIQRQHVRCLVLLHRELHQVTVVRQPLVLERQQHAP